jgi:hypothetical protein
MNFWSVFFSVLAGIVAGVFINLGVRFVDNKLAEKKDIKNLVFEIAFNIRRIDSLIEELQKYRDALNADNLKNYFGYFSLSKVIVSTLNQMVFKGSIYKHLGHEEISWLQNFVVEFSPGTESFINSQVGNNKEKFHTILGINPDVKAKVDSEIKWWKEKFVKTKTELGVIKNKLEGTNKV